MDLALFGSEGLTFIFRWIHFLAGITWIGLLYYFNFVQGPFFNEVDGATKSTAIQKLVPRALWWFRWSAMFTFFSGWLIIGLKGHHAGMEIYSTSWGIIILTGAALGTLMWANVWFVIWPSQKVVIRSAVQVAQGGQALPEAAGYAARAGISSRHNVLFSVPMLFFMGAASHLPLDVAYDANVWLLVVVLGVIFLVLELNSLKGKLGPLTTIQGVITSGIVFALALYGLMECLL